MVFKLFDFVKFLHNYCFYCGEVIFLIYNFCYKKTKNHYFCIKIKKISLYDYQF